MTSDSRLMTRSQTSHIERNCPSDSDLCSGRTLLERVKLHKRYRYPAKMDASGDSKLKSTRILKKSVETL